MFKSLKGAAIALAIIVLIIATGYWVFRPSGKHEPEDAIVTSHYYPGDDDAGQFRLPHVRHYSRCDRYRNCSFSGYEVRHGGKRSSIGTAGLTGAITDYADLDDYRLLIEVNDIDLYVYPNAENSINGSGFAKVLRLAPNERWIAVALEEPGAAPWAQPAHDSKPKYFIAGTRLIEQKTLKVTGNVPLFRPVYFDGTDLYFVESTAGTLRLYAMTLPASAPDLIDEMPAACLNERGAAMLMDAREIKQYDATQAVPRAVLLRSATVNATKAGNAFRRMSEMPRSIQRITFQSLRWADFFDRYKTQCHDAALTGSPSMEQIDTYYGKIMDTRQREK